MEKQTQPKEKNNIWQTQQMVQPHGFLKKKKKKNPIYGLPIHQVKQKLKSEKEKPNIKKKIS